MSQESEKSRSPLRRLYDWTLAWAERPGGIWALFLIAFLESSVFPIPPDVLLVALCVGCAGRAYWFALVCTAGSVLGGVAGYAIGYWAYELVGEPIVRFFGKEDAMAMIKELYLEHGFLGILFAAITPVPFKIFTIASGYFRFPIGYFIASSVAGRSFRFMAVATVLFFFGPGIRSFIDRYFNLCALLFMILLLGGFAAMRLFW